MHQILHRWTIRTQGYHPPSSQFVATDIAISRFCCYRSVDTSADGQFVPKGTIHPVVGGWL
jgi:hypothetical protein